MVGQGFGAAPDRRCSVTGLGTVGRVSAAGRGSKELGSAARPGAAGRLFAAEASPSRVQLQIFDATHMRFR
eukprot:3695959-Lingulodinium_polyedra.AAC.1